VIGIKRHEHVCAGADFGSILETQSTLWTASCGPWPITKVWISRRCSSRFAGIFTCLDSPGRSRTSSPT